MPCEAAGKCGKACLIAIFLLLTARSAVAEPILIAGVECELTITPVTSKTLRVTFTRTGQRIRSDGVLVSRRWAQPALKTTKLDAERTVSLKALRVIVRPSPLRVNITTSKGQALQQLAIDEESGAVTFGLGQGPLFGLGSGGKQFDRRGGLYEMIPLGGSTNEKPTHGFRLPLPFLLSTDGWGVFVHRPYAARFDLRGNRGTCRPPHKNKALPLDLFVMHAEESPDLMREQANLTGRAVMPPRWALGYFQSHRTLSGPEEVTGVAEAFRRRKLPCDGLIYLGTGYCPTGGTQATDRSPSTQGRSTSPPR